LPEQKNCRATSFSIPKFFSSKSRILKKKGRPMKTEEVKTATKALNELNDGYLDLFGAIKSTSREAEATKKLWREGNKSKLIKIGIALIVFPEPTPISATVGACFVAAGAVQKGIKNQAVYLEDIKKTFQNTLKDVWATKDSLRI
jgi:hypothetical protein